MREYRSTVSTNTAVTIAISSRTAEVVFEVVLGVFLEVVFEVVAAVFFVFELQSASSLSMRRLH